MNFDNVNPDSNSTHEIFPQDVIYHILSYVIHGNLKILNFKNLELVSKDWYRFFNSRKLYIAKHDYAGLFVTTNKNVKKDKTYNHVYSIYPHLYPKSDKIGKMSIFSYTNLNITNDKLESLAEYYHHDISKLHFRTPISTDEPHYNNNTHKTIELFMKCEILPANLPSEIINEGIFCDTLKTLDKNYRKLTLLYKICHCGQHLLSNLGELRKSGKIVKDRHLNNFEILNDIFQPLLCSTKITKPVYSTNMIISGCVNTFDSYHIGF